MDTIESIRLAARNGGTNLLRSFPELRKFAHGSDYSALHGLLVLFGVPYDEADDICSRA